MTTFTADAHGRARIEVSSKDGSSIVVYEQGAHLANWKNAQGEELLYLSPKAVYSDRVPLRGGVPLIFPQFGSRGNMTPSHGFARVRPWELKSVADGSITLALRVDVQELGETHQGKGDAEANLVELQYTILFSNTQLRLNIKVINHSEEQTAKFHFAFHTYFAVSDIERASLNGLNLSPYINIQESKVNGSEVLHRAEFTRRLKGEFDRIYPSQACAVIVQDAQRPFVVHVSGSNLSDVCVWNPGAEKGAALSDLPEDGYKHFVCIEHGSIVNKVSLSPSSSWSGSQNINLLYQRKEEQSKL